MDGVIGIVLNKSGKVLLIKRKDIPLWCLPGGDTERKESPEKAIAREMTEETGLKIRAVRQIGMGRRPDFEGRKAKGKHFLCQFFICRSNNHLPRKGDGVESVGFWSTNKLPSALIRWHKEIITAAFNNNFKPVQVDMKLKKELVWLLFHPLILYRFIKLIVLKKGSST